MNLNNINNELNTKGDDMPIKKWVIQYIVTFIIMFLIFSNVQYLKGHEVEYSFRFGVLWSIIATTIFLINRIYYYRKKIYCVVCNDLPKPSNEYDTSIK